MSLPNHTGDGDRKTTKKYLAFVCALGSGIVELGKLGTMNSNNLATVHRVQSLSPFGMVWSSSGRFFLSSAFPSYITEKLGDGLIIDEPLFGASRSTNFETNGRSSIEQLPRLKTKSSRNANYVSHQVVYSVEL